MPVYFYPLGPILVRIDFNCPRFFFFSFFKVVSASPNIAVQEKEVQQSFPSFSKYTISAVDPQAAVSASISIGGGSCGQSIVIPVTLIQVADPSAAKPGERRGAGPRASRSCGFN